MNRKLGIFIRFCLMLVLFLALGAPQRLVARAQKGGDEQPPSKQSSVQTRYHTGSGPFDPPKASDSQFVIDTGNSTLDTYLFRDQGPIQFNLPVTRVVGPTDSQGYLSQATRDRLVSNKIISEKAYLRLMVYDVDEDYSGTTYTKEIDKVYLNDNYIGTLSGANDTWSVHRIEFPVSYLKFAKPNCTEYSPGGARAQYLSECSAAPTSGQNVIRIDIDTGNTGLIWAVEVDWATISFDAADPILFVHGMGGSNGSGACNPSNLQGGCLYWDNNDSVYWFNFRGKFSATGFLTQITENFLGGDSHIEDNARVLAERVELMKTRYGVDQINLVAHSKGGLDSRGYISNSSLNSDDNIAKLVTLATPHHGSALADLGNISFLADLFNQPLTDARHDLSEIYVNLVFNPTHWAKWGVQYYTVTADMISSDLLEPFDLAWQINSLPSEYDKVQALAGYGILKNVGMYRGRNDILVTTSSSKLDGVIGHLGLINTTDLGTYVLNHHSIRAAEKGKGEEDSTVANKVMSVLKIGTGLFGAPNAAPMKDTDNLREEPETEATNVVSQTSGMGMASGTINQGNTSDQIIGVDSNSSVSFTLLWMNGDLNFRLIDPTGLVYTSTSHPANVTYSESRIIGGSYELLPAKKIVYTITNPTQGNWIGRVLGNTSLPGGTSSWAILTSQNSQAALALTTDQSWYRLGNTITLTARLLNGSTAVTGATVQAVVHKPGGTTQTLTMFDNGTNGDLVSNDGNYTAMFSATLPGTYRASSSATWSSSGVQSSRIAETEVQVASSNATIGNGFTDSGIDINGDGMYDQIRVDVPVTVNSPGSYTVTGLLRTSTNEDVAFTNSVANLPVGTSTIPLLFNASEVSGNDGSGPFILRDLKLLDNTTGVPLQLDYNQSAYITNSYSGTQLQHEKIALSGATTSQGIDTNSNGQYDRLDVSFGVNVDIAGTYQWNARLVDSQGGEFEWVAGSGSLAAGANTITLSFDGKKIYSHFLNGPYYLTDLSMWGNGLSVSANYVTATPALNYTQFEASAQRTFLPVILNDKVETSFNSQFNNSSTGWVANQGSWNTNSNFYYNYGSSGSWASASYNTSFSTLDYQARLWRYGCESCSFGIIIRGVPNPINNITSWDKGYAFFIARNGYYSVFEFTGGGDFTNLIPWTYSSAILQGNNYNIQRVVAKGGTLRFYVNGTSLGAVSDSTLTVGLVGLVYYTDTNSSTSDSFFADWAKLTTAVASPELDEEIRELPQKPGNSDPRGPNFQ